MSKTYSPENNLINWLIEGTETLFNETKEWIKKQDDISQNMSLFLIIDAKIKYYQVMGSNNIDTLAITKNLISFAASFPGKGDQLEKIFMTVEGDIARLDINGSYSKN